MADEAQQGEALPEGNPVEATETATTPEVEATAETPDPEPSTETEGSAEEPPKKSGVQERISQLTARAKAAEEKVKELEELSRFTPQDDGDLPPVPTPDQFDYDEGQYQAAMTQWASQAQAKQVQQAFQQQRVQEQHMAQAQAMQAQAEIFAAKSAELAESQPDFYDRVRTLPYQANSPATQAMLAIDNGPAVAYHLASNPQVAAELNRLPPLQVALKIANLSHSLATPVQPKNTGAPPPVTPVHGNAEVVKDPDSMTADEWLKHRNKQLGIK